MRKPIPQNRPRGLGFRFENGVTKGRNFREGAAQESQGVKGGVPKNKIGTRWKLCGRGGFQSKSPQGVSGVGCEEYALGINYGASG